MASDMAMTPLLLFGLLLVAILLPTLGAVLARLVGRQSERSMLFISGLTAALAMASVIALQFARVDQVALGQYAIFVPARAPLIDDQTFALERPTPVGSVSPVPVEPPVVTLVPTVLVPTLTTLRTPTVLPTAPASRPTMAPTDIQFATDTPVPTATTAAPAITVPTATVTKPVVRRRYTVQKGDSLRTIAADFNVSVQALLVANGLTPKEGDNLQIGQKLIIPAR